MSRRKTARQKRSGLLTRRRPSLRVVIAVGVVLSLAAAWTMFAYTGAFKSMFRQKGKKGGTVSTASFNSNGPSKEYIYAGGRLVATEEPSTGCGTAPSVPGTLTATATSSTSVSLSWPASTGTVDHYEVERRSNIASPYVTVIFNIPPASPTVNATDNNSLIADTAYIYRVRAFADNSANCPSPYSVIDLATTTVFAEVVVAGVTIKALHLTELRTAVNAVRTTAGLATFDWGGQPTPTEIPISGGRILRDQVKKLRDNLNPARAALGLPPQPYTNDPLNVGDTVYAVHIQQLRDGVK
jgi:hypothetical protein